MHLSSCNSHRLTLGLNCNWDGDGFGPPPLPGSTADVKDGTGSDNAVLHTTRSRTKQGLPWRVTAQEGCLP